MKFKTLSSLIDEMNLDLYSTQTTSRTPNTMLFRCVILLNHSREMSYEWECCPCNARPNLVGLLTLLKERAIYAEDYDETFRSFGFVSEQLVPNPQGLSYNSCVQIRDSLKCLLGNQAFKDFLCAAA